MSSDAPAATAITRGFRSHFPQRRMGKNTLRNVRYARHGYSKKYTKKYTKSKYQPGTVVSPFRKFVYNDTGFTQTFTSILPQLQYVFRGNSLFDPDQTGAGVQPYGYDQLCPTFYTNYNVKSSKITIYPSVAQPYITNFPPYFTCVVVPYRASTLPYNEVEDIRRMPGARSIRFTPTTQANMKGSSVSSFATTSMIIGKEFADDVSATGQYDGSPTYAWYWIVVWDTSNWPVTADVKIMFDCKIQYYTKLLRKSEFNES